MSKLPIVLAVLFLGCSSTGTIRPAFEVGDGQGGAGGSSLASSTGGAGGMAPAPTCCPAPEDGGAAKCCSGTGWLACPGADPVLCGVGP